MSILDAHPTPKPGAHWPDGFRERAQATADKVAAERNDRPRLVKTGNGYADHIGDAIAGYEPTPEIVPQELGGRPARVIRVRLTGARPMVPSRMTEDDEEDLWATDRQRDLQRRRTTRSVKPTSRTSLDRRPSATRSWRRQRDAPNSSASGTRCEASSRLRRCWPRQRFRSCGGRNVVRLLLALALLSSCAAVRPSLCAASDVALTVQPETPSGRVAVSLGRFLRAMFCPREAPMGSTP